jgi:TonB-dependent receptor
MRGQLLATSALFALAAPVAASAEQAGPPEPAPAEIIVTGQRAQLERSIELKREALGVVDVAAADEIGRLPDRNVAEVVERLPGVGVQYDQGEGRYVAVRGVPAELNQYTINGFEVGNPDGSTRRLPLDVISGQLLNRVEVFKVKTPDQDGQGIGGLINLVPQTAFDFRQPLVVQATGQVGFQDIDDRKPVRGDASVGGRFGDFGVLLGASYSDRTFNSYGFFPDDWAPVAGAVRGGLPINIKFSEYEIRRERLGAAGSLDWRPAGDHQFWVRGIYSRFTEDEYRQRYRIDFADDAGDLIESGDLVLNPAGTGGTSTDTGLRQDLRLEYKEKSVLAGMAGGTSQIGGWTLDYGAARIHNEVIEPNQVWQFRNASGIGPVDFDFSDRLFTAQPRNPVAASNIQFRQYTEQDENGEEDIWALRGDANYELALAGAKSFVRFGAKYRTTDKTFDAANTIYGRGSSANRFTLADSGTAGGAVEVPVRNGDSVYVIPISIDDRAIVAFTRDALGGPLFVLDEGSTLADDTLGDLDIGEDVLAGYGMVNLDWGRFALTAGLRVERTDLKIGGFQLKDEDIVTAVDEDNSYTNWLPSIIGRFTPAPDLMFRLAYHRSVGRPQYSSLSPGGEVTVEADEAFVELGNPTLRPFVSDNFDLSAEYYFGRGSFVAAGAFYKKIKDPIFTSTFIEENSSFGGTAFDQIEYTRPVNGRSGEILGLELAYEQQLTFLPGALSGLGIGANVTWVDSDLEIPDGEGGFRQTGFAEQ